ncbi:hypothetical protein [Aliikangiella sp. IMCC44359]|uniref:hypothetical protein n=1 Tax=Aliikangiella sp. IMCC44359 TaxID=3459125 RepID=UPI00403B0960
MLKKVVFLLACMGLSACADNSPVEIAQGLLGYTPPPEKTTISEELRFEYQRCMKIGSNKNCAQAAYDVVRKVKGLEPRTIPKGIVIILEGDGGHTDSQDKNVQDKPKRVNEKKEETKN